jgi:hypothetical protein
MGIFYSNKGQNNMQLTLIKNTDLVSTDAYKIARTIYAQTGASSLTLVEAMTSMIQNISKRTGVSVIDIVRNKKLFPVLNSDSPFNYRMNVSSSDKGFQMCVRVASRMLSGGLGDCCFGATCFHNSDEMPLWATSRGYIADIDGVLFYL